MNHQVKLAARPVGMVQKTDFSFETAEMPTAKDGQVLIETIYVSLDPAMRGWMNDSRSYIKPVQIGDVFRAGTAGKVIESHHPDFQVNDYVTGGWGVQQFGVANGKDLIKVDTKIAPLSTYMATLGMPGMTAYFGILNTGQPKAGETVVVSGAAGAVGSVVGQIAKIKGCRVVGIAGGQDKCDYCVNELGFDACVDYKSGDLRKQLKAACPEGIDVYFDNVGGDILDVVLGQIKFKARIVICGAISQYNNETAVKGPSNYLSLLVNRARMEGIVVFDNAAHYHEAAAQMAQWIQEGTLASKVHIVEGIENFYETLTMLFTGKNFGKLILKVGN